MEVQNIAVWASRDEFEEEIAAFLILDLEPKYITRSESSYYKVRNIIDLLIQDKVACRDTSKTTAIYDDWWKETKVVNTPGKRFYSKAALKDWCEKNGFRPKFLRHLIADGETILSEFQEGIMSDCEETKLDPREEKSLLKILAIFLNEGAMAGRSADDFCKDAQKVGVRIDAKTVRKFTEQAKQLTKQKPRSLQ